MADMLAEPPRIAVELPMQLFLRIADGDGQMTAQEMERFDALLAVRDWCRSDLLRRSLAATELEKGALWKQYVAGNLRAGAAEVAAGLDAVLRSAPSGERQDIEADLIHFCRELLQAARGRAWLPRRDPQAQAAFDEVLELIRRPSARVASPASRQALAEQKPHPAWVAVLPAGTAGSEMFWRSGKLTLRCIQTIDETHDVRTFRFVNEPPKLFQYHPGQFITLDIPLHGKPVRRSYTISSSPSRPYVISITVKRVEGGRISNWLYDNLAVGEQVSADGPHGKFTCMEGDDGPYLFISGGSGVTPLMAMSRWLHDTAPHADIRFLHFARTPEDLIFAHELQLMQLQLPNFRCDFVCSRSPQDGSWSGPSGRISQELLTQIVPDLGSRSVYLCGPVPFMETTRGILEQLGFDMGRFQQESFGGVPRPASAADLAAAADATVVFAKGGLELACKTSDYILDLALNAGVEAAFSCRSGQCGTCKVILVEGSVEHDSTDGLAEADVKDGFILLCQAHPKGRVVVEL